MEDFWIRVLLGFLLISTAAGFIRGWRSAFAVYGPTTIDHRISNAMINALIAFMTASCFCMFAIGTVIVLTGVPK